VGLGVLGLAIVGVAAFVFGTKKNEKEAAAHPTTSATATTPPSAALPVTSAAPAGCPAGMVSIPGGRFFMGSDQGEDEEKPEHNVTLKPYCIDKHEVTVEQYKKCSDQGACKRASITNEWEGIKPEYRKAFDPLCNIRDPEGKAKHPINCVNWEMADRYCKEQGKRLPTEAEWEFATRGSDGRKYPWGQDEPTAQHLNACGKECEAWGKKNGIEQAAMYPDDDGWPNTAPVGSFPKGASPFGVEDVVGNVWEWTADWYGPYAKDDQVDPVGPKTGEKRSVRGGAWNGRFSSWVRPTFRYSEAPSKMTYGIGFRCAK
jgi:formylglycine-generating enzyme required for sulfatase activity